ncbi:hypothetical protein [Cellulomonas palmilytica]|uniref:hypothetical protein n=1 Tax=Cellulomonas palmilytica TaxID=2608402 RepID=UPI001F36CAEF|nr:hypothetical protein [Cellulomonas palmilytica]UJP40794.1 hypothetical protein F1D97_04700 [Cellulomonas palmilytica]
MSVEEPDVREGSGSVLPAPPVPPVLDPSDGLTILRNNVESALLALPGHFAFDNPVSGINATDLFNLNTLMGAGIEVEVVRALNGLRDLWDPDNDWKGYTFERSSQAFPDVRLTFRSREREDTKLGIELKGWFTFAKEGVPSLRYQVSPAACALHDMVCVVPWYLSNAVSGSPRVAKPWVESARYAAEWRDYWWEHVRREKGGKSKAVTYPVDAAPYPSKAELVSAVPAYDGGKNFGRLPRCKPLMDAFIDSTMALEVLGIPVSSWVYFLKQHTDQASPEELRLALETRALKAMRERGEQEAEQVVSLVEQLVRAYTGNDA